MSSHENCAGENQHEIRSKNDNKRAYLMFKNRSRDRRVAIYWKNYKGERVRYRVLEYGHTFSVNTYETHPWVFADADTGDRLVGNGCMHYMPTAWAGEPQRTVVQICLPGKQMTQPLPPSGDRQHFFLISNFYSQTDCFFLGGGGKHS